MAAQAAAATVTGIVSTTVLGIGIVTAMEMRTVMVTTTVDCIAVGTNIIAITTMIGTGIMIAAASIATTIRITNATMTAKYVGLHKKALSQAALRGGFAT